MPSTINWFIKDEILYVAYAGTVTADELRNSLMQAKEFIESSPRPLVHVITDVGDVTKPTSPKESLDIVREAGSHERAGWNLILREKSLLMKIGIAMGTSLFKMRTRTFDTMDEIEEFLKEKDSTIHWEKADRSLISV